MTLSFLAMAGFIPGFHPRVAWQFAISTKAVEISPDFFRPAVENTELRSTPR
jgi:hypothetical protein